MAPRPWSLTPDPWPFPSAGISILQWISCKALGKSHNLSEPCFFTWNWKGARQSHLSCQGVVLKDKWEQATNTCHNRLSSSWSQLLSLKVILLKTNDLLHYKHLHGKPLPRSFSYSISFGLPNIPTRKTLWSPFTDNKPKEVSDVPKCMPKSHS